MKTEGQLNCVLQKIGFFGGKHLDECKFDEQFKNEVESQYSIMIMKYLEKAERN